MSEETENKRALVIGAHPDDNEFGAGGTSAKLAAQGWDVTFIIVTNGNKGSHDPGMSPYQLSETREQEQRAAAEVLGVKQVIFLAAMLSISVGIFNLLPIHPLDGGQMLVALAEMIRGGKRLSIGVQGAVAGVGLVVLLFMIVGVLFLDVNRAVINKPTPPTSSKK